MSQISSKSFHCPDCNFSTDSQNGVVVHRIKIHPVNDSSIKSVSVVRSYPEGKKFLCCICGNTIGSFPNFNRHFKNNHPNTSLVVTGLCSVCGKEYPNARAASVHCKVSHGVSKKKDSKIAPPDPDSTPIKSVILDRSPSEDQVVCFNSPKIIIDHGFSYTSSLTSVNSDELEKSSSSIITSIPDNQQDSPFEEVSNDDIVPIISPPSPPIPSISKSSVPVTSTNLILNNQSYPDDDIQTPTSQMINECAMELFSNHTPPIPPRPIPSTRLSFDYSKSSLTTDAIDVNRFIPPTPHHSHRIHCCESSTHTFAHHNLTDLADSISATLDHDLNNDHAVPFDVEDVLPNLDPIYSDRLCSNQQDCNVEDQVDDLVDIPSSSDLHSVNHMTTSNNSADRFPLDPNQMNGKLCDFQKKWIDIFSSNCSWDEFCGNCSNFAYDSKSFIVDKTSTKPHNPAPNNIPHQPPKRPPVGRGFHRFDKAEAQKIQALYYYSKKKATRKILADNSPTYTGSINSAEAYFRESFSFKPCDINILKEALRKHVPSTELDESLFFDPTKEEIQSKLRSTSNTSPGPDHVEYRHLKKVDPSGEILYLIFKRCFKEKNVPPAWKSAITILIHKKSSTDDAANFRPIALMSCIYKLLMGIITKRLTAWAISNDLLSKEQKSARPGEGCYEHTFLLQSIVGDARRLQKNIFQSWLDLRNAFGSIAHQVISTTLEHMGAPLPLVEFIMNSYTNASTKILTSGGFTDEIPVLAGVKQGCPLSPILFNLCIELIIRSIKSTATSDRCGPALHHRVPVSTLVYADDLVIISRNKGSLQHMLDEALSSANILGLSFRPDKCASLSFTNSKRVDHRFEINDFIVQDQVIPALNNEEHYRYLGVPIGIIHNCDNLSTLVENLIIDLEKNWTVITMSMAEIRCDQNFHSTLFNFCASCWFFSQKIT